MTLEKGKINDANMDFKTTETFLESVPDGLKLRSCIQCGSCSSSCPAGDEISATRRHIWRMLQMGMMDEVLDSELFWDCTTCSMCEARCPRGIPLSDLVVKLREKFNESRDPKSAMKTIDEIIETSHNITGDAQANRLLWIENLSGLTNEQKENLIKEKAEVAYFPGCVSSLFPQSYKIPQSIVKILIAEKVDFTILGEDEWCCGYPKYAGGFGIEAMKSTALHNIERVARTGAKKLLVSCPTCYHIWKNEYPEIYGKNLGFEVQHYTEYLGELFNSVKTNFTKESVVVTYHDPCDLGRKSKIVAEPRKLIARLPGVEIAEMRFVGSDSKCCGGGGNLEMLNPELSGKLAEMRLDEALATGAGYILTSCQQCKRTLQGAARKKRARVKVLDLLEFIADRYDFESGGERN